MADLGEADALELIVTHVGADFDAFAAVVVARRLHPDAVIFFPGSREESVRRFEEARSVAFEELRQRQIAPDDITRVILCDVRQGDRLGVVAQWLADRPGIERVAYDHHPASEGDVEVGGGILDPEVGATCTLLAEELARREIVPTAEEATLLLMGIYEDTGSLTYATTHPRDCRAAAWSIERGGDLAEVRRYAVHSLDRAHVEILYRMTRQLEVHRIRGHRVGMVALELGRYVEELAPLVSRCLEIFELPMLFGLFGEGDRVTVIARGDVEGVHLGSVVERFAGGGGHATAAAGSVRDLTVLEARERLVATLLAALPLTGTAAEVMVQPFVAIPAGTTVAESKNLLNRARINAAPVLRGELAAGAVTRQLLDAALQHDLGDRPVETVMEEGLEWVDPGLPVEDLARRLVRQSLRFVLVGTPGEPPRGLVTRTMALQEAYGALGEVAEPFDRRARESRPKRRGVARLVEERVPPELRALVDAVAGVSRALEMRAYLVGGFVRDLLLQRENRDLDVVVEGDGPAFARELGRRLDGQVRVHEAFLTATVTAPGGLPIDVATARTEFYRAPAALPEVRISALRMDLFRRDFTINTLALRVGPEEELELVDYFGAQRDLDEGMLRVLHSLSFIDDPTRVLRAVRLELRLGFRISPETERLVAVALSEGVFDQLSGARLRDELGLLLEDPVTAIRGLERLEDLGVLRVIEPELSLDPSAVERLRSTRAAWDWYRLEGIRGPEVRLSLLQLMALSCDLGEVARERLAGRLDLAPRDRERFTGAARLVHDIVRVLERPEVPPHAVRRALDGVGGEELLLVMGTAQEPVRAWVRRDLEELRHLSLAIGGRELIAAGHRPGPAIGAALEATLEARLDGRIGAEEEVGFALARLEERRATAAGADTEAGR